MDTVTTLKNAYRVTVFLKITFIIHVIIYVSPLVRYICYTPDRNLIGGGSLRLMSSNNNGSRVFFINFEPLKMYYFTTLIHIYL